MSKLNKEMIQELEEMGVPKEFIEAKELLETETIKLGYGAVDEGIIFMGALFTNLEYTGMDAMFELDMTFNIEKGVLTFTEEVVVNEATKESVEYKELAEKIAELGFKFVELGQMYENTITHGIIINYSDITSEKLDAVANLWFEYNQENLEISTENEDLNDGGTGYNLSLDELK